MNQRGQPAATSINRGYEMATKREERKKRADAERESREQRARQRKLRSGALIVVGVVALAAVAFMSLRRDGEVSNGRVWSAAHGHWHDK